MTCTRERPFPAAARAARWAAAGVACAVLCATVAPAAGARTLVRTAAARPDDNARRLYVSTVVGLVTGITYAYEIRGGLVSPTPVLTYGSASGPYVSGQLAAGPYDQLLTANDGPFSGYYGTNGLTGFYKDSTTVARSFYPPTRGMCEYIIISALAALPSGAMFVGYYCYFSGSRPVGVPGVAARGAGIIVYDATSPTTQKALRLLDRDNLIFGLATDAGGDLYVSRAGQIDVYATPGTQPQRVRTLRGASFAGTNPGQLAVDRTGELYVVDGSHGTVSAYPPGARGRMVPDRTISTLTGTFRGSIAVYGNTLFADVDTSNGTGVVALDKRVAGAQTPRQFLSVPDIFDGITVAP